jgi:hypothetical protein
MTATVHCAKGWTTDYKTYPHGLIPGGPTVTVERTRPGIVLVDHETVPVASWAYTPEHEAHPKDGKPYTVNASIEARLPMENGAILDITWPDREEVMVSVGKDDPDGWRPLRETADKLTIAHRGCPGAGCTDYACMFEFYQRPDDWTLPAILAAWRQCGVKPIDLTDEEWPKPNQGRKRFPMGKLEKAIRAGQTVTLDEWRKMTG